MGRQDRFCVAGYRGEDGDQQAEGCLTGESHVDTRFGVPGHGVPAHLRRLLHW